MWITEILESGITLLRQSPAKDKPTFSDWADKLKARHLAHEYTYHGRRYTSTDEQYYQLIAGQARLLCIGCAVPWDKLHMDTVVIGGVVQIPSKAEPHPTLKDTLIIRQMFVPVHKKGLGCPACVDRYQHIVRMTGIENEILRRVAKIEGKSAREHIPFLDVFDTGEALEG